MEKVGWIFTQSSKERDYIMNSEEICQMAAWQDEVGEHCVTGVVSLDVSEDGSDVHFEAFQVKLVSAVLSVLTVSDAGSDVLSEAFQGMLAASSCDR